MRVLGRSTPEQAVHDSCEVRKFVRLFTGLNVAYLRGRYKESGKSVLHVLQKLPQPTGEMGKTKAVKKTKQKLKRW